MRPDEITWLKKDPDAKLDYGFDWSLWLQTGETISASIWTIPSELTKISDSFSSNETIVWLQGGENKKTYTIANKITTNQGRIDERSIRIVLRER
jgi:hypothetical protein